VISTVKNKTGGNTAWIDEKNGDVQVKVTGMHSADHGRTGTLALKLAGSSLGENSLVLTNRTIDHQSTRWLLHL